MDEESRALHAEGCAPGSKFGDLPKLPSSSVSNGGLDKGFNLPPMESLLKLKTGMIVFVFHIHGIIQQIVLVILEFSLNVLNFFLCRER